MQKLEPDVEAIIENFKPSKNYICSGYRPAHQVKADYLTTGEIILINCSKLAYGEKALGYISFITPEAYPNSLWVGKKIAFQEGNQIHGYSTITKIFNKLLENSLTNEDGNDL